jgi:peptidoglycan hydrolase CwlO-like protein
VELSNSNPSSLAEEGTVMKNHMKTLLALTTLISCTTAPSFSKNPDAASSEVRSQSAVLVEDKPSAQIPVNTSKPEEDVAKVPTAADVQTAKAASKIPGVNVDPHLMAQPVLDPPIKGFHPIKRIMRPVENLAKQSVALGQQIMRLEGPIASLQPSMLGLEKRMSKVQDEMTAVQNKMMQMQVNLNSVQSQVSGVRGDMHSIGGQMNGVRGDLSGMRTRIVDLQKPIKDLRGPIVRLHDPIKAVADPVSQVQQRLSSVEGQLADLKTLLATILFSIYVAAAAIALGTPVAAFVVYKNRRKLFPHTPERDFPATAK